MDPRERLSEPGYRAGEIAEMVGVEPRVLRYWQTEFGFGDPSPADSEEDVIYSQTDLDRLLTVKKLLREEGYSVAAAKKKLKDKSRHSSEAEARAERRKTLTELREAVEDLLSLVGN